MQKQQEILVFRTLNNILSEQADAAAAAGKPSIETDDINASGGESPFTPAEKRFLGKFDAYGAQQMGIIYSLSDIGIREFLARSGKDFNLTAAILIKLLRDKLIKLVPYTGWGRDDNYTIELQLPLEDIAGFGKEDEKNAEKKSDASGAPSGGGGGGMPPLPGLQSAGVIRYGDLLKESAKITERLLKTQNIAESKHKTTKSSVHVKDSRMLKHLPKHYVAHLEQLIDAISKKQQTSSEKQRLIADILDNLHVNFKLTDKQIAKSFEMHKKQKRFQKFLDKQ